MIRTPAEKARFAHFIGELAKKYPKLGDAAQLAGAVDTAETLYGLEEETPSVKLQELKELLPRAIALLESKEVGGHLRVSLGSDGSAAASECAEIRRCQLLGALQKLFENLPDAPDKLRSGPRPKTGDLYLVADSLAKFWMKQTGDALTAGFDKLGTARVPRNRAGTAFVYDVVEYIAPARLPSLRKVVEKVVKERKRINRTVRTFRSP